MCVEASLLLCVLCMACVLRMGRRHGGPCACSLPWCWSCEAGVGPLFELGPVFELLWLLQDGLADASSQGQEMFGPDELAPDVVFGWVAV